MKMNLKALRAQKGMSQEAVAKSLNKSPATLSAWENARSFPNVIEAYELAKFYNVKLDDIIFLPHMTV